MLLPNKPETLGVSSLVVDSLSFLFSNASLVNLGLTGSKELVLLPNKPETLGVSLLVLDSLSFLFCIASLVWDGFIFSSFKKSLSFLIFSFLIGEPSFNNDNCDDSFTRAFDSFWISCISLFCSGVNPSCDCFNSFIISLNFLLCCKERDLKLS